MWFPLTLLTAFLWALINVINSGITKRYTKDPSVILWVQVCFSMIFLTMIGFLTHPDPRMSLVFLPVGVITYLADLLFFWICSRLDISVMNAAWCLQSVILSAAGIFLFHELWTPVTFLGAVLVILGVLLLSLRASTHSFGKTALFIIPLALLYIPNALARKVALTAGMPILPIFFWLLLCRDGLAFTVPWFLPSERRKIMRTLPTLPLSFFVTCAIPITLFFTVEYVTLRALAIGPLSIVSVVGNVQPFFVLGLAWLLHRHGHHLAPNEIVTKESIRIKALSFFIAFIGLALLALSQ